MKRAKTKTKHVKKQPVKVDIVVLVTGPHATMRINVDVDKLKTKQMPKLLRQLADIVETGEFENEIEKVLGVSWRHENRPAW